MWTEVCIVKNLLGKSYSLVLPYNRHRDVHAVYIYSYIVLCILNV